MGSEPEVVKHFHCVWKGKKSRTDVPKAISNIEVCLGNLYLRKLEKNREKWKKIKTTEMS